MVPGRSGGCVGEVGITFVFLVFLGESLSMEVLRSLLALLCVLLAATQAQVQKARFAGKFPNF